jgi:hypothetical protein
MAKLTFKTYPLHVSMPVLPLDVHTGGSPRPNCHPVLTTAPFGQDVDLALPFWPLNSRTDALLVCYFANQLSSWVTTVRLVLPLLEVTQL